MVYQVFELDYNILIPVLCTSNNKKIILASALIPRDRIWAPAWLAWLRPRYPPAARLCSSRLVRNYPSLHSLVRRRGEAFRTRPNPRMCIPKITLMSELNLEVRISTVKEPRTRLRHFTIPLSITYARFRHPPPLSLVECSQSWPPH